MRNICREFVDDRNGYSRYVQNIEDETESTNNKDNEIKSFLDDDDDDDMELVKDNNQTHENTQDTQEDPEVEAEILDLICDQF